MHYKIFQYRLPLDGELDELNQWVQSNRVVNISQYCVPQMPAGGLLVFVVETIAAVAKSQQNKDRVDYKETLSSEDFALYSELRALRKQIADAEGVPVYSVFTNAQLACMVQQAVANLASLQAIEGVGQGRVDRYGDAFLAVLVSARATQKI
jgi:superfamily II DNA helicase RecQ